jgi:hypothetical protein
MGDYAGADYNQCCGTVMIYWLLRFRFRLQFRLWKSSGFGSAPEPSPEPDQGNIKHSFKQIVKNLAFFYFWKWNLFPGKLASHFGFLLLFYFWILLYVGSRSKFVFETETRIGFDPNLLRLKVAVPVPVPQH